MSMTWMYAEDDNNVLTKWGILYRDYLFGKWDHSTRIPGIFDRLSLFIGEFNSIDNKNDDDEILTGIDLGSQKLQFEEIKTFIEQQVQADIKLSLVEERVLEDLCNINNLLFDYLKNSNPYLINSNYDELIKDAHWKSFSYEFMIEYFVKMFLHFYHTNQKNIKNLIVKICDYNFPTNFSTGLLAHSVMLEETKSDEINDVFVEMILIFIGYSFDKIMKKEENIQYNDIINFNFLA